MFTLLIVICSLLIIAGVGALFLGIASLAERDLGGLLIIAMGLILGVGGTYYVFDMGREAGYFHGQVDAGRGKVTVQLVTLPNGERRWESK